jgi:hypothetical protein
LALAFYSGLWAFDGWWVPGKVTYLLMQCLAKEETSTKMWLKKLTKKSIWRIEFKDYIKMHLGRIICSIISALNNDCINNSNYVVSCLKVGWIVNDELKGYGSASDLIQHTFPSIYPEGISKAMKNWLRFKIDSSKSRIRSITCLVCMKANPA